MPRVLPPPLSLALTFLREARGWTQQELATAAGLKRQLLCDLEKGARRTLERGLCETLVAAMGYGPGDVTLALLFVGGVRRAAPGPSPTPTPLAASVEERRQAQQIASRAGLVESYRVYFQLLDLASSRRAERTRNAAKKAWESFRHLPVDLQRQAVEKKSGTLGWALVELLCDESARAGYDDAARALDLAGLAERAAECLPGEPDWRSHVQGYALAFRGNAQRIANHLFEAEATMALAWRLWRSGEGAAASPFAKWRLLDLEASLRRCQSRFGDALRLLDDAMVAAPEVVRGRILLKKAYTYEQAGEIESALTVLQDAAPRVEAENDRGLDWALAMNRVVLLAHVGRFGQAEYDLAKVQRLAVERGNRLDVTRVLWLTARVSAGLGRSAAARDAWAKARQEFIHRGTAIDAALVTLELSVFDLNERQPVDWIGLEEAAEIFRSSGMARETIAARSLLERRPHPRPVR